MSDLPEIKTCGRLMPKIEALPEWRQDQAGPISDHRCFFFDLNNLHGLQFGNRIAHIQLFRPRLSAEIKLLQPLVCNVGRVPFSSVGFVSHTQIVTQSPLVQSEH